MTHYLVITPVYTYIEVILDDGTGPAYDARDVVHVEAPTRKAARWEALKTPEFRRHLDEARGDGHHPCTGLKVEDCLCPHGWCHCDGRFPHPDQVGDYCEACYEEHEDGEGQ